MSSGAKEEEAAKGEVSVAVSRRVMGVMALVRFWYRSVLPIGTKCLFFFFCFFIVWVSTNSYSYTFRIRIRVRLRIYILVCLHIRIYSYLAYN